SAAVVPGPWYPGAMTTPSDGSLTALAISCTLKRSPAPSSTDLLARQLLDRLGEHGVTGELVRAVDHDLRPGVEAGPGDGDPWPAWSATRTAPTPSRPPRSRA